MYSTEKMINKVKKREKQETKIRKERLSVSEGYFLKYQVGLFMTRGE